ncbi:MAG: endonuclease/exonuclease/phosphatase family protein [Acidobacteriota bacterium]
MLRKFVVLAALSLALAGWASAAKPGASPTVSIMTQNLDDGTDLTYVIAALTGQIPLSAEQAVDLTYLELHAGDFEKRARFLARNIADRAPEVIALQEAVLWRVGPTPESATDVLFDQLDLLLSALRKNKVPYDVVATVTMLDLALPGDKIGGALRFTDRNAILVRSDLQRPGFFISNVQSDTFTATFDVFGFPVPAGWISADIHTGTKVFRLFTTHLQTPIAEIDAAAAVQLKQADELIALANSTAIPVVICGDFNSDASNAGPSVDDTLTVGNIEASGYADVWPFTHRPRDLGLTWPLFLEDQFPGGGLPPPFFADSEPFERIDLFFSKNIEVRGSSLVITPVPGGFKAPPFASDHAGVIATFKP